MKLSENWGAVGGFLLNFYLSYFWVIFEVVIPKANIHFSDYGNFIFSGLNSMSIDLENLRESLSYVNTAAIDLVQQDLDELVDIDKLAESESQRYQQERNTWCTVGIISVFAGFVLIFPFILTIVAIFLARRFNNRLQYYRRLDLPNHRYQLLKRLLTTLQLDMKRQALVSINLNFTPPDESSKLLRTVAHPSRPGWNVQIYEDPWLCCRGRFQDGTHFFLKVIQNHQVRTGTNINRKQRYKPRFKGFSLSLVLNCDRNRYSLLQSMRNLPEAINLPDGIVLRSIQVMPQNDRLKVHIKTKLPNIMVSGFRPASTNQYAYYTLPYGVPTPLQSEIIVEDLLYQTILSMFLSLYQILNFVRIRQQHQEAS